MNQEVPQPMTATFSPLLGSPPVSAATCAARRHMAGCEAISAVVFTLMPNPLFVTRFDQSISVRSNLDHPGEASRVYDECSAKMGPGRHEGAPIGRTRP